MTRGLRVNVVGALAFVALLTGIVVAPESPVADAAMRGDVDAVRTLLKQGADVNAAQGDGMTALHWAAARADVAITEMLVYGGANVSAVTRIGAYTPLHLAAKAGSAPVLKMLLDAGARVDAATNTSGATALHFAAGAGDADAVAVLLERGADANARESSWGQTPLIFAAANNRPLAIKALLGRGADPNITTNALDLAAQAALAQTAGQRQREVLQAFGIKTAEGGRGGFGPPAPGDIKLTPSQARAAALAVREVYLSGKADPNAAPAPTGSDDQPRGDEAPFTSPGGLTALHHATRQGYADAVIALLDGGADIDKVSGSDETSPLLMAAINGQFDMVILLVERGADPNLGSDLNGVTPLWATVNSYWQPRTRFPQPKQHEMQKATYLNVMEALLKAGANPDARMTKHPWYMVYSGCGNPLCGIEVMDGATAFWRAAYATDVEAMRLLVTWGADAIIPTRKPPFRVRTTRAGIFTDGEKEWKDPTGLPDIPVGGPGVYPIHAASGVGYGQGLVGNAHVHVPGGWLPSVKYMVEELGADVNMRDHFGYTPLHHAAARGDRETILYLVAKGADVSMLARTGQTVADMANGPVERVQAFPEIVKLLEALGSGNNHMCVNC